MEFTQPYTVTYFQDFADAVDKVSRAGYVGKHGTFTVPSHEKIKMNAWRKQAQYGDYGTQFYLTRSFSNNKNIAKVG